jgi:hypothetical protein
VAAARNGGDQNFLPILLRVLRGATAGATDITGGVPSSAASCLPGRSEFLYPPVLPPSLRSSRGGVALRFREKV